MTATAYLFPGQGAQSPEHGELVRAGAPDLLALAVELIGEDPVARCGESTRFAQPAIVLASLALWRGLQPVTDAAAFAGHSLGELSALAAAGVLSEEDAVRLAVARGALMDEAAAETGDGSMLAALKGDIDAARALADAHGLYVANDNAPGQVVLAGPQAGIDAAQRAARDHGLRAIELDVAGAFHTPAMQGACEPFAALLQDVVWGTASAPVFCGLRAQPFTDYAAELVEAIVAPVRWREVMGALDAAGMARYVDVGPGDVLQRLVDRNLPEVRDDVAVSG